MRRYQIAMEAGAQRLGEPMTRFLVVWHVDGPSIRTAVVAHSHRDARRRFRATTRPLGDCVEIEKIVRHPDDRPPRDDQEGDPGTSRLRVDRTVKVGYSGVMTTATAQLLTTDRSGRQHSWDIVHCQEMSLAARMNLPGAWTHLLALARPGAQGVYTCPAEIDPGTGQVIRNGIPRRAL